MGGCTRMGGNVVCRIREGQWSVRQFTIHSATALPTPPACVIQTAWADQNPLTWGDSPKDGKAVRGEREHAVELTCQSSASETWQQFRSRLPSISRSGLA